jgi:hypothetical protein
MGRGGHKSAGVSTWDGEVAGPLRWQLTPCLPPASAAVRKGSGVGGARLAPTCAPAGWLAGAGAPAGGRARGAGG